MYPLHVGKHLDSTWFTGFSRNVNFYYICNVLLVRRPCSLAMGLSQHGRQQMVYMQLQNIKVRPHLNMNI